MSSPLTIIRQGNRPGWLATVDMHTGHLHVNGARWDALDPVHRRFILLHEEAHYHTKNPDELLADCLAFSAFIGEGHHPRQAVHALQAVLNPRLPEHQLRLSIMGRRAARHLT